jgi:pilus assembly protein Flp/PilA
VITRTRNRRDERGASAVEYGLLVALIAAVIVIAVVAFGGLVTSLFNDTCSSYSDGTGQVQNCDN